MPRQFANQGDRLVFSNGILILSGFAILLIVAFQGDTHALLPLYAVGVFMSFTLSQSGMVRRWLRLREKGWQWRVWVNGVGAVVTGIVLLTLAVTKFVEGAWIVVFVIPILVTAFVVMHRHYEEVARELSLEGLEGLPKFQHTVLVLIGDVHRGVVRAVQYARTLAPTAVVRAVYVETDPTRTARLEERWGKWDGVPLVVLTSPYRSLLRPFLDYLDQIQSRGDEQMVTIVLPEFLPRHWWQHVLHNQTALLVKGALLFRKNTVVADVPYLLRALIDPLLPAGPLPLAQHELLHLAGGGLGQIAELDRRRALKWARCSRQKSMISPSVAVCARLERHERLGPLAPVVVRDGDDRALQHRRVRAPPPARPRSSRCSRRRR